MKIGFDRSRRLLMYVDLAHLKFSPVWVRRWEPYLRRICVENVLSNIQHKIFAHGTVEENFQTWVHFWEPEIRVGRVLGSTQHRNHF